MLEIALSVSILALIFAAVLARDIRKKSSGTSRMQELMKVIHDGAISYLNRQYRILVAFVIIVAAVLYLVIGPATAGAFVFGAVLSALAGNMGMRVATASNARTAQGCKKSLNAGLWIAFSSGAVMGMSVVGLGLLGVVVSYYIFGDPTILFGFGFGASSIALFARVGGGIYTKAADMGADLVGKVEAGIPEDDPRNPGVIADNVGDNVGDVAGMGADLFESYVDSLIAAMVLGAVISVGIGGTVLPLIIATIGIISSIIGTYFVKRGGKKPHRVLNQGIFSSAIIMAVLSFLVIFYLMGPGQLGIFTSVLSGLLAGIVIGLTTEFYTSASRKPTRSIAEASQTGPAINIVTGFSVGMESAIVPVLAVSAAIIISFISAGLYGIAIAAVGMLSTLGITLATDTYGPVADNAAGIAEMAGMGKNIREKAETLDEVGNTTAAIGKGFAIGSAALTALALFSTYAQTVGLQTISITAPSVIAGLFIGGLLPFVFSSFTMRSVSRTAYEMINEIRRQFRTIKGILQGRARPDYNKCIEISTSAALKEMILPSAIAILSPIVVGFVLGAEALGGMLAGTVVTGFLLALTLSNSGGAWDNAKKYIETGKFGGKGSESHKSSVVGDTVGDPFKDTSGPSLNILIKLISIIALVFASLFL